LLRHGRREDGQPGYRSRLERRSVAVLAALGRNAGGWGSVRIHRCARSEVMDLVAAWDAALQPSDTTPEACTAFAAAMRARKLTFGDRVHCPFLRPFLLSAADEARIRRAAETLAALGERVALEAVRS